MRPLPRSFAARDAVEVAQDLLGCFLVRIDGASTQVARIVETEAYVGPHDKACHSSKGRTARTEVMFGPAGYAYVYLIYGMHHCFNVVTGNGAAVLIRGAEPVEGFQPGARGDGPGRLAKLMNITREHNARPLDGPPLFLAEGTRVERPKKAARIGVDYAGVWAKRLLRFYDPASRHVSRGR